MRPKVLITSKVHEVLLNKMNDGGYDCIVCTSLQDSDTMNALLHNATGIITSNSFPITKDVIEQAPKLKWIGRLGSGMDIIDVDFAAQKNIVCYSSPEGNSNAVAEHGLGLLLSLQHKIVTSHVELKNHIWKREENRGVEIAGKTACIIGYGNNGAAFAHKLKALDVNVIAYDKYYSNNEENEIKKIKSFDDIFNEDVDILSFHVPLNTETAHYFNQSFLDKLKKSFTLLNLSRGQIVDIHTVVAGMQSGKITAAGIDVWDYEPLYKSVKEYQMQVDKLMTMSNFIGTPHIAGYTVEALQKMSSILADKILSC